MNKGTVTKRYGPANCNVPHTRTRADTCAEAGGRLSHPTPTTWLCSGPGDVRAARTPAPAAWPANSTVQVWARNLSKGDVAVAVYNNGAGAAGGGAGAEIVPRPVGKGCASRRGRPGRKAARLAVLTTPLHILAG